MTRVKMTINTRADGLGAPSISTRPARAWPLHPVMVALCLAGLAGHQAYAREYFNPAFLDDGSGRVVDLSAYETAGVIPEGDYLVDVFMNQKQVFTRQMHFAKDDKGEVLPTLTPAQLKSAGVAIDRIAGLKGLAADAPVKDLRAAIPGSTVKFDMAKLRLDLTVPQVDMLVQDNGAVDPALWDEGVPGMMFNYMLSGTRTKNNGTNGQQGSHSTSLFGTVNGGANLGAWRLRSTLSYNKYSGGGQGYNANSQQTQFTNTYLQRDVPALRGEMYLGEKSTGNDVFADSVPFRGVQLVSEEQMLPNSARGFSPVVTGIASSTARVSVRKDGVLVYETTVPPGPFRLTDIYNAGSGGQLEVTVTEADGTKHVSTQSYSTLTTMKRPGAVDYEVSAGKYHTSGGGYQGSSEPIFAMATAKVGLPQYVTLYGGLLAAEKYQSAIVGVAASLGWLGAASLDATLARAHVNLSEHDGQGVSTGDGEQDGHGVAWRMRFTRRLESTGTSLDLSATRYDRRYMTFQDVVTSGRELNDDQAPWLRERRRSNRQVNLSQALGALGSLYLRASRDDYWNSTQEVKSVGAGFSSSIKGVSYNVDYSEDRTRREDGSWPSNRQVSLNVSVPFSLFNPRWDAVRDIYASYSVTHDNQGRTSQQTGMNGSLLDSKLSWNVSQSHDNQGGSDSGNAGLGWSGDRGNTSLNYGYSSRAQTLGGNASGAVVIHPHGVTLTRMLGDSMALVEAPGAGGVKVGSTSTDSRGYAVVPYLQTYQRNTVNLDTTTLPDGVDVPMSSAVVYPTKGAIVEAKFKTRVGRQAMLTLNFQGQPVPFGAIASLPTDDAADSAIVGDGGMLYLTGAPQSGQLKVSWGNAPDQQCRVRYDLGALPKLDKNDPNTLALSIVQQTLTCQPVAGSAAPVQSSAPDTAPATTPAAESLPVPANKP